MQTAREGSDATEPEAPPAHHGEASGAPAATHPARELALRAEERFAAGDYEAALAEFTRAHQALGQGPSRAALLNNIAVCHERLFRYDLALRYYEQYLREAQTDAADRREVEAVIDGLRGLLGKLHVTSNVRAEIWVDDRALGFAPGDVELPAGKRVVKLRALGRQDAQREVMVVARATRTAHFELEALPEYHGIAPTYFWTGVALTSAALIAGTGLGVSALVKRNEAEELRGDHLLTKEAQAPMLNQALAADICFGAAALFGISSLVLLFVTDFRARLGREQSPAGARAPVAVRGSLGPRALSLSLSGAWP